MTVITAYRTDDVIVFAADRAAVGLDNNVKFFRQKLLLLDSPNVKGVISGTGIDGFADAFCAAVAGNYDDFDGIVDDMEIIARQAYEKPSEIWRSRFDKTCPPPRGTLLMGGWSNRNKRCELYIIHSAAKEVVDSAAAQPWTVYNIDEFYCSVSPSKNALEFVGLADCERNYGSFEWVIRHACAARQDCVINEVPDEPCGIGGQIDAIEFSPDLLIRWVAHTWPDRVGRPTDPSRGCPTPASFEISKPYTVVSGFGQPNGCNDVKVEVFRDSWLTRLRAALCFI